MRLAVFIWVCVLYVSYMCLYRTTTSDFRFPFVRCISWSLSCTAAAASCRRLRALFPPRRALGREDYDAGACFPYRLGGACAPLIRATAIGAARRPAECVLHCWRDRVPLSHGLLSPGCELLRRCALA